ncbi:acetyl-CoA carboxylase biotin carboxyl carrier protein subunit, partial [Streptomyces sp. NPDC059013]|uniref:acetyl-CoA carboxylase biotin carboxyl carrier protein subunit n=1 Tax=Streptomyces sp. NPDC059013 TaxID=3346697 RepID=UPI003676C253
APTLHSPGWAPRGGGWGGGRPRGGRGGGPPPPHVRYATDTAPVAGTATVTVEIDGLTHTFHHAAAPGGTWLGRDGDSWYVQDHDPVAASLSGAARQGADTLSAPMPGTVTVVKVAVGDEVAAGQSLLVVEAMKMEHVISAPHAGTVSELDVTPGTTVVMDQVLAVVAPHDGGGEEGTA